MRKNIFTTGLIVAAAIAVIGWDLSTSLSNAVVNGTYRYEADFDAVSGATTKVGIVGSDYAGLANPVSRSTNPTYQQVEGMVAKAIELQGGFNYVISKGDKVMIKVNLVGANSPSGQGENTDVRVVKALIKLINTFTAGDVEIIVAEGTARTNDDPTSTTSVWANSGYRDLLTDSELTGINFRFLNLNQTTNDLWEVDLGSKGTSAPQGTKYHVHKEELLADVYISVPVLKIHDTGITNALKLQIGSAPGSWYGYNKMAGTSNSVGLYHDVDHRRWTTEAIVDLCQIASVDFVVVDALMCLQTKKTYDGTNQIRMNTIIAGVDPVAVDHVATKIFCLNPDDIAHITLAEKMGLGTNDPDKIEIMGNTINEVKKKVFKNTTANGQFGQSNRTWILSQVFAGTDIDNEYIANEATLVPKPGVNNWTAPVYFFDDRIDLRSFYNDQTGIVTYAFTQFSSPKAQTAELWLGTHEAIKIYLNGVEVFKSITTNIYSEDANHILTNTYPINLLQGENTLLVKTLNNFGDYSFALNICAPESTEQYAGNRVDGLKFYINSGTNSIGKNSAISNEIQLSAAPVPARYSTKIQFELPESAPTTLYVHDMSGRIIKAVDLGELPSGINSYIWNLKDNSSNRIPSGTYSIILKSGNNKKNLLIVVRD